MSLKVLNRLTTAMLIVNFAAVFSIATEFLFSSQYIAKNQLNFQLLSKLDRIPAAPGLVFWQCILSLVGLVILIEVRHNLNLNKLSKHFLLAVEFVLAIGIYFATRMNYNGIFLLILVDCFLTNDDLVSVLKYRFWIIIGVVLILIFAISNYSFLGNLIMMPSIATYLDCLPTSAAYLITFLNNFISALNLILFIWIALGYSIFISDQEHIIKNKLSTMSKTNRELKSYAALSKKIAEDQERKRIARDLHDTVGHALTGISAGVDAANILVDIDPENAKKQLGKISNAINHGLHDIRQILNKLRPDALENYTLETSLRKMLNEYSSLSHLKISLRYDWGNAEFEKTTEIVIFRVIEEAVTNALRHGHAKHVQINCTLSKTDYFINIQNDGEPQKIVKPGYGLTQMKERLAIINGHVSISGYPKFTIKVSFPRRERK